MSRRVIPVLSLLVAVVAAPLAAADPAPATGPFTAAGPLAGVAIEPFVGLSGQVAAITHAGDARLFVTLLDGRVMIVAGGTVRAQPFLDIRSLVSTGGERGLLSAAFHPRYGENGFFFVDYTDRNGDTVIARYRVSGDANRADPDSARVLLNIAQPFANHNGGQLQFGPDGYLYVGMGDGGAAFDPDCRAQKGSTLLGKMLRIDVDQNVNAAPFYGVPVDNPYRGDGDPLDEIWASGVRNPWRFSFDRLTGDLWIADVGQNEREEVDFQSALSSGGENYGWKVMEATRCSSSDACPGGTPTCHSAALTAPVLEYLHGPHCSITGGYVYRGGGVPPLAGAYVFGDLCSGVVWAAFRAGASLTVRVLPSVSGNLTTFGEDSAGELYAGTLSGSVLRFVRTGGTGDNLPDVLGLYDPIPSRFQLKSANTAGAAVTVVRFGPKKRGWLPLAGDWDGDGRDTVGLYDSAKQTFHLAKNANGRGGEITLAVDAPLHALPVVGDWDGDGDDSVGLFDPDGGRFLLKNSLDGSDFDVTLTAPGTGAGLLSVAGDWNGDGRDDVGTFDPASSTFHLAVTGGAVLEIHLDAPAGGLPVTGDWDGDGRDGVGVYDPGPALFRVRNALTSGAADASFRFGPRRGGWRPIAGAF